MAEEVKKNKSSVSNKKKTSGGTNKKKTGTVNSKKTPATKKSRVTTNSTTKKVSNKEGKKPVKEKRSVLYIEKNVDPEPVSLSLDREVVVEKNDELKTDNELRKIPVSHYIIVGIIIVWILIFMYIGYKMTQNYQEKLYDEGYFIHKKIDVKKTTLNELNQVIANSSSPLFLFFNYRGIEETYELEKEMHQIMNDYHLQNNFYYIDLTDMQKEEKDMADEINQVLGIHSLLHTPAVFYYNNGNLVTIAQREDKKILEAADFVKVLDMYEFKK